MAQIHSQSAGHSMRPTTPNPTQPLAAIPRLSPSRMPDQLLTASFKNGHMNLDTFSPVNQNGSFEFDRVLRSGRVLRRVKKKGAWKSSWKPSYLVLRPNLLSVYKNTDETELRASVTLTDVTAVARVKKSHNDYVFGVFTPAKNYHFSAMNEVDTLDWVTYLRIESRLEGTEEYDLPAPGFPSSSSQQHHNASDTTDLSAEDDMEMPGSPEGPQWAVRGNKPRVGSASQRKPGGLREYSGNEPFTTSQSDLSDAYPGPPPSSSFKRAKPHLTPIPDNSVPISRPSFQRSASQLSITQFQGQSPPTLPSQSQLQSQGQVPAPQSIISQQTLQQQQQEKDPNRVIRHSYITLIKSNSSAVPRQSKAVWAVLRPSSFALYKSSSEYEPLKILSVSDLVDAVELDPLSKSKQHCFQVIGVEKTLKFCVETESEMDGWLGGLKSVINAKKTRGRGLSAAALGSSTGVSGGGGAPAGGTGGGKGAVGTSLNLMGGPSTVSLGNNSNHNVNINLDGNGPAANLVQNPAVTAPARRTSQQLQRTPSELGGIVEALEQTSVSNKAFATADKHRPGTGTSTTAGAG